MNIHELEAVYYRLLEEADRLALRGQALKDLESQIHAVEASLRKLRR